MSSEHEKKRTGDEDLLCVMSVSLLVETSP